MAPSNENPELHDSAGMINDLSRHYRDLFQKRRVILTFQGFIGLVKDSPRPMIRNAAEYIRDTFDHYGKRMEDVGRAKASVQRFKLFDTGTEKNGSIIGGEPVQGELYNILQGFVRQGYINKLILLHGPNGSAKSS